MLVVALAVMARPRPDSWMSVALIGICSVVIVKLDKSIQWFLSMLAFPNRSTGVKMSRSRRSQAMTSNVGVRMFFQTHAAIFLFAIVQSEFGHRL